MLWSMAIASGVIFLLALGWAAVDRLWNRTMSGPDVCDLPRHECSHCLAAGSCSAKDDDRDA